MKKISKLIPLSIFALFTLGFFSCGESDDEVTPTIKNNDTTVVDTIPPGDTISPGDTTIGKTKTEMISKKWIVDEAYVNVNTPDNSSKGLKFDIRADGTYTLSTGYVGTWEFQSNETEINWDKGTQFNQVFKLNKFTDTKIDATFKSAFTGQNARWVMIPQ